MTTYISQDKINATAWAACDTFRGTVDPAQYKDYILVMLFLKYISDVWQDHYDTYRAAHGNDTERIERKLSRERFVLPTVETGEAKDRFRATFQSLYERRNAPNIGELINITLAAIEENRQNKPKLEGVFRNIDFNSEANLGKPKDRNRRLKALLEDFHKPELDMHPRRVKEDIIGNTYMYLIERFATDAGKKAGEFFTPAKVSELIARLVQPKPGNTICDPACGSGGLLIQAAKQVGNNNFALFGQESMGSTWALCRMNMFLHNFDSARIEWCDTLNNPQLIENDMLMQFDCVVANPPFSLDKWGAEGAAADVYKRFWRGVPPKSKGDWAFISHMVEITQKATGRAAVVVPHGVLFRGGAEGRIRKAMIEENLLDTVIGLPGNMFQITSIPVAVLIFDKSREPGGAREGCKDVLFIDASRDFVPNKKQKTLAEEHIRAIVKACTLRQDKDKYAHVAALEEIADNDYNLNIPRYVDTFEEEEPIDIDAVQQEIEALSQDLKKIQAEMAARLAEIER